MRSHYKVTNHLCTISTLTPDPHSCLLCKKKIKLACLLLQLTKDYSDSRSNFVGATDPADQEFIQAVIESVRTWLDNTETSHSLELPPCNSYRRLLQYHALETQFGGKDQHSGFWVRKMGSGFSAQLVLQKATAEEAQQLEAAAKEERLDVVRQAAGFSVVFELMRKSGKPAVGHNPMFDISYALQSFADPYLPSSWLDFKQMVRTWFPGGIYDTKYLSRALAEVFEGETSLSEVYTALVEGDKRDRAMSLLSAPLQQQQQQQMQQQAETPGAVVSQAPESVTGSLFHQELPLQIPSISHAPGFDKYQGLAPGALAHEAGYDAYMTGAVFACLLPLVQAKVLSGRHSPLTNAYREKVGSGGVHAANGIHEGEEARGNSANGVSEIGVNGVQQQQPTPSSTVAAGATQTAADAATHGASNTADHAADSTSSTHPGVNNSSNHNIGSLPTSACADQPSSCNHDVFHYVRPVCGRINLTKCDVPFAALLEEDPIPHRPCVFYVAGLNVGYRAGDVIKAIQKAGISKVSALVGWHMYEWNTCLSFALCSLHQDLGCIWHSDAAPMQNQQVCVYYVLRTLTTFECLQHAITVLAIMLADWIVIMCLTLMHA